MNTLPLEKRLEAAKVRIMIDPRFVAIAGLLMITRHEVSESVKTAQTDGMTVKYGRGFCSTLTDAQLRFIVLHELLHTAYGHMIGYKAIVKQDPQRANMAMDYVINQTVMKYIKYNKTATVL